MNWYRSGRLAALAGATLSVAGVIFVAGFVLQHWSDFRAISISPGNAAILGSCLLLYLASVMGNGAAWVIMVRSTGASVGARFALWVYLVSQYGKYVPGNVWHFISRATLSTLGSVHPGHASYVMVVETMVVSVIGAMLSLAALAAGLVGPSTGATGFVVMGLVIGAVFIRFAPRLILSAGRRLWAVVSRTEMPVSIVSPGRGAILAAAVLSCFSFTVNAVVLQLLGTSLIDGSGPSLPTLIGVFAFSWTAGFVTPGAPGGVGIRDGLLVSLLSPMFGAAGAVTVTLVHRLLSMLGDTVALGLGVWLRHLSRERPGM